MLVEECRRGVFIALQIGDAMSHNAVRANDGALTRSLPNVLL